MTPEDERATRLAEIRDSVAEGPCAACGDEDAKFLLAELQRVEAERDEARHQERVLYLADVAKLLQEREEARADARQYQRVAEAALAAPEVKP